MTKEQQLMLQNLSTPATLQNLSADMRFIGGPTTSQQRQLVQDVAMAAAQQQAMEGMQQPMGALPVRQFMPTVRMPPPSQSEIDQVYDQARASGRNVFDYSVLNKPASPPPMTGPFPPSMMPQQNSPVPMQPYLNSQVNRGPQQPSPFAPQQPSMGSQFSQRAQQPSPFAPQQPYQAAGQRAQQPSPFAPQQPSMGPQPPNQAAGQRAKLF
jgi:hypothetical protein